MGSTGMAGKGDAAWGGKAGDKFGTVCTASGGRVMQRGAPFSAVEPSYLLAVDPGLCAQLLPVRAAEGHAALHVHEEHDPQEIRRALQGHLRRDLRKVSLNDFC